MTPQLPASTFKPFKSFKTLAGLSDGLPSIKSDPELLVEGNDLTGWSYLNPGKRLLVLFVVKSLRSLIAQARVTKWKESP
jgi:hypothetical protein